MPFNDGVQQPVVSLSVIYRMAQKSKPLPNDQKSY